MNTLEHIHDSARNMRANAERQAREHHADDHATWLSMYAANTGQALADVLAETNDPLEAERVIGTLDREALESIAFGAALSRRQRLGFPWSWPDRGEA